MDTGHDQLQRESIPLQRKAHFDEPSEFGYNEGRASKIWIERDGRTVFNYDRGMDIKAADRDTKAVLEMLMKKLN